MSVAPKELPRGEQVFQFAGLPCYSRDEAALWNWCHACFAVVPAWKRWIGDAWGDLLEVPVGVEICLTQSHSVNPQEPARRYELNRNEILIGREADNDISLPALAVGKRHARIFTNNGQCFVEDLGSALGSYLNQTRLSPKQPAALTNNDQIAIFPYIFSVALRQLWAPQTEISVYAPSAESTAWQTFLNTSTSSRASFSIEVHPNGSAVCLEVSRAFLRSLVERFLRPLGVDWPRSTLSPQDSGVLEFAIISLLERINRDLAFPFQFDTKACGSKPQLDAETRGIVVTCSLNLGTTTGAIRVFAPYATLDGMRRACAPLHGGSVPQSVSWAFEFSLGHLDLTVSEAAKLELDDVLLFKPELALLYPGRHDRGWRLSPAGGAVSLASLEDISNLKSFRVDDSFEREQVVGGVEPPVEPAENKSMPDLGVLPMRVHVIVGEKELTLAEANGLAIGTILELNGEKNGQVSLAVNGRIVGEGQLVEVEGRLGVKILGWKGA